MTDKQIIGGRGAAKSRTTLNTIEVMLENEKLKSELKAKEQECEELKEKLRTKARGWANVNDQILKELAKIKENVEQGVKIHDDIIVSKQILQKINEVVDGKNS